MKSLHTVTFILLIIGGLNWLLVGIMEKDLFEYLNLSGTISMIVYVVIGLAAIYEIFCHKRFCRNCNPGGSSSM